MYAEQTRRTGCLQLFFCARARQQMWALISHKNEYFITKTILCNYFSRIRNNMFESSDDKACRAKFVETFHDYPLSNLLTSISMTWPRCEIFTPRDYNSIFSGTVWVGPEKNYCGFELHWGVTILQIETVFLTFLKAICKKVYPNRGTKIETHFFLKIVRAFWNV